NRLMLGIMFQGSNPSDERTTPIRIDRRISRTSTIAGGPPKKRVITLLAIGSSARSFRLGDCTMPSLAGCPRAVAARLDLSEQPLERLDTVGLAWRLVPAQAIDAGKAHRQPRFVAARSLQAFERHFEHETLVGLVHNLAHGAETVDGIAAHEPVDCAKLGIGEAEIRLADRNQLVATLGAAPDAERIVGIERRALAAAALRIHEHCVDNERIALPLPPKPLRSAREIGRVAPLEHHALDCVGIGAGSDRIFSRRDKLLPSCKRDERR